VPLTVILLVSSARVRSAFRADATRRVTHAQRLSAATIRRQGEDLARGLRVLAADSDLTEALYRWASPGQRRDAQADLIDRLKRARADRGLALLQLTTPGRTHRRLGPRDGPLRRPRPAGPGRGAAVPGRTGAGSRRGPARQGSGPQVSLPVGEGSARLYLTGGVLVDADFLARLPVLPPDSLVVELPDGHVLTSPTPRDTRRAR